MTGPLTKTHVSHGISSINCAWNMKSWVIYPYTESLITAKYLNTFFTYLFDLADNFWMIEQVSFLMRSSRVWRFLRMIDERIVRILRLKSKRTPNLSWSFQHTSLKDIRSAFSSGYSLLQEKKQCYRQVCCYKEDTLHFIMRMKHSSVKEWNIHMNCKKHIIDLKSRTVCYPIGTYLYWTNAKRRFTVGWKNKQDKLNGNLLKFFVKKLDSKFLSELESKFWGKVRSTRTR